MTKLLAVVGAAVLAFVIVVAWPRLKCARCGDRFWAWNLSDHIGKHLVQP